MDFYDILDQIIDLLKHRGRASYRALKIQFKLDDESLEAMKEELVEVHQLAIDHDGKILVWKGESDVTQEPVTKPNSTSQPEPQPVVEPSQPIQDPFSPVEARAPDAERRQLTVMFCDLVDSTALSGQLDPEDLRDVIRAYQATCTVVIERFEGYIAQHLGDGLMVYFGWPQAHEDDVQRAVRAGLGIVEAMAPLNARLAYDKDVQLGVRIGIHTGPVVIGEIGSGVSQEQLALGETPNVAARIQGLAEVDAVVLSAAAHGLVQGYFACEDLGEQALRGVAEPLGVYRVLRESGAKSRLEVATIHGLTPLVGRESEVALLLDRWEQVQDGRGQVVLLRGEAGIGKSRLVQVLKAHIATTPHTRLECRSSPYYQNTALYPITDLLQRTLGWEPENTAEVKLHKLEKALGRYSLALEETVPLFATSLSLLLPEDRYPPLNLTPQRQRQKTLETLVAMLVEESERQPVFFIIEDLHWTDPTTLELLELLFDQCATTAILTLLTCRPEFEPHWSRRSHLTEVALPRLSKRQMEWMVERVAHGKRLPEPVLQELIEKTDGVPLYLEEMTRAVVESGVLKEHDDHYELTGSVESMAIPATLHDSLMARLDRLASAKGVAQLGAVIGRTFSYELLESLSPLEGVDLEHELQRLVEAELVFQRGLPPQAMYTFKHALIQDAAYQSQLKRTRQQVHGQIVELLETRFPETVRNQPELLARHCRESGQDEMAMQYWQLAGQQALEQSSYVESIAHLRQGLSVLTALPKTLAHLQQELAFQVKLGTALTFSRGFAIPEAEPVYVRAQELCGQLGDTPQLFSVLRGLMTHYQTRGETRTAHQLGEQLLRLAQSQPDRQLLMLAHYQLGMVLCMWGKPASSQTHLAQALAVYPSPDNRALFDRFDFVIAAAPDSWLTWAQWQLGYPDRARQHIEASSRLEQEISHPYTRAHILMYWAVFHQFCREAGAVHERASELISLATAQGLTERLDHGIMLRGWALAMQGQSEAGIAEIRRGLVGVQALGSKYYLPYFLGLLAQAYGANGRPEEGLLVLDEAIAVMNRTELYFCEPELYRLKATLLLEKDASSAPRAEACYVKAIEVARHQQAKSWELRAAISLARLWQSQGKHQDAHDLLAPVYNWFTEGFDTADLLDAKLLLNELVGASS